MVDLDTPESHLTIFIILLALSIPSIACSLYIFYQFIKSQELRSRVNNHIILILLIISFIQVTGELPLTLIFLYTGSAAIPSAQFCQFWIIFDYALFTGGLWTMSIACIERYWLVFHRAFFDRHIILLHYIPMLLCTSYPLILYISLVIKYPCTNYFDFSYWTCGGACYLYERLPGTLDWTVNGAFDVILSTVATWAIIIRVVIQKRRANTQRTVWQRSHRLIIQMISLSALYMIVWIPCDICFVITLFTPVPFLTAFYGAYLSYYQYIACLLCPFACLLGSADLRQTLRRNRTVHPPKNHEHLAAVPLRETAHHLKYQSNH